MGYGVNIPIREAATAFNDVLRDFGVAAEVLRTSDLSRAHEYPDTGTPRWDLGVAELNCVAGYVSATPVSPSPTSSANPAAQKKAAIGEHVLAVQRIYDRSKVQAAVRDLGKSSTALTAGSAAARTEWPSLSKRHGRDRFRSMRRRPRRDRSKSHSDIPPRQKETTMPRVSLNQLAPEFSLPDVSGSPVSLSDYRGRKNVLLVFNRGFT